MVPSENLKNDIKQACIYFSYAWHCLLRTGGRGLLNRQNPLGLLSARQKLFLDGPYKNIKQALFHFLFKQVAMEISINLQARVSYFPPPNGFHKRTFLP